MESMMLNRPKTADELSAQFTKKFLITNAAAFVLMKPVCELLTASICSTDCERINNAVYAAYAFSMCIYDFYTAQNNFYAIKDASAMESAALTQHGTFAHPKIDPNQQNASGCPFAKLRKGLIG